MNTYIKLFKPFLLLILWLGYSGYSQGNQEKINHFFIRRFLLPYYVPEFNPVFKNAENIIEVKIVENDSLHYTLIPRKDGKMILADAYATPTLKEFDYFSLEDNVRNDFNLLKSKKQVNYRIIYTLPYNWVDYDSIKQELLYKNDTLIQLNFKQNNESLIKYKFIFKGDKLYKLRRNLNKYDTSNSIDLIKYKISDTAVIEDVYSHRGYDLAYKNVYFFNLNGDISIIIGLIYFYYLRNYKHYNYSDIEFFDRGYCNNEIKYKYKYDKFGNWVEQLRYEPGVKTRKISRQIIYKDN